MSKEENKLVPKWRFPEFSNGWEERPLGEIGEFIGGGTPETNKPEYWDGPIQWFTPTEVKDGYLERSKRTITIQGLKNSSAKLLPIGALLITTRATIGDVGIARNECCTNQGFQSLVVDDNQVNVFWYYWLNQNKNLLIKKASGSTFPEIGKTEIVKIRAFKPTKAEQQKIADCLSSLDELITAHSAQLEALKAHKKGLLQQLFPAEGEKVPRLRFPEFQDSGEWEEKKLGDIIEIKGRIGYRGYTTEDIVSKGEGAISLSPSNFDGNGSLNFDKCTYITWEKYEESPEIMLQEDYIVLVKTGSSYGKAAIVKSLPEKTTINPQIVVLKPKDIHPFFLFLIVSNSAVQKLIRDTVVGGAIPTLSQESISKFEVLVPPDTENKEQQKIASCLSSVDVRITAQTERLAQLKLHKKGLMQGLFPDNQTSN